LIAGNLKTSHAARLVLHLTKDVSKLEDYKMLNKKYTKLVAAMGITLFAGAAQAATTNGFANGGFEISDGGTGAESWLPGAAGYTQVCGGAGRSGDCAAQLMSPPLNAAVMLQNSIEQGGLPPLTEGDNPLLSFFAKGFAGTTGNVVFALRYLDGVGNILSNSGNVFFEGLINESTWTEITYDLGAVPTGATAAFIEISQGIGPVNGVDLLEGTVLIDDLYLGVVSPVPVPAAVWLFGSGLLGLVGVARRRKS
jgi:hypothetical protein